MERVPSEASSKPIGEASREVIREVIREVNREVIREVIREATRDHQSHLPPLGRQSEVIREAIRDHHPTCRLVASNSINDAIRVHQGGHQRSSSHLPSRRLHLDQGNQRSSGRPSEVIIPPAVSSPPPRSTTSYAPPPSPASPSLSPAIFGDTIKGERPSVAQTQSDAIRRNQMDAISMQSDGRNQHAISMQSGSH